MKLARIVVRALATLQMNIYINFYVTVAVVQSVLHFELLVVSTVLCLVARAVSLVGLRQPLVLRSFDEFAHIVAHHVAERLRVVYGLSS